MFRKIFGSIQKTKTYGNDGRFGQKNSSATRKIIQSPRFMYKKSYYMNNPDKKKHNSFVQSRYNYDHRSRRSTKTKSRRNGFINATVKSSPSKRSRKYRSKY